MNCLMRRLQGVNHVASQLCWPKTNPVDITKNTRSFYRMLNAIGNRPDKDRIKEVGPDRACAEWLLRCGGHVKWVGYEHWHTDYNTLPPINQRKKFKISEISCDEAGVMDIGFTHLEGLKHLKKIRFNYCPYLEDEAVVQLDKVKDTLEHLEIISCGDITDKGVMSFSNLQCLKTLVMFELTGVRNKQKCYDYLRESLPGCDIDYHDVHAGSDKG